MDEQVNYADSRTDEQREEDAKNPPVLTVSEPSELDAWWEKALEMDTQGRFVHSAEDIATKFNCISSTRTKDAWDIIKLRARYGYPAATCHKAGMKFTLGTGRREKSYVVGNDGAWRKVAA